MGIDLDQLRTFVAVAEAGGLSRAAETLHLSLPAISRRLSALEDDLGIALLERTTRRVTLTQTGREFLPRARRVLDDLEESLLGIRESASRRRGVVTLACIPNTAYYFLPATLSVFAQRFPEVRVRVLDRAAAGVRDAVATGSAEFGVGIGGPEHADVEFRRLRQDPFVLVCRREHKLANGRDPLRWRDLKGERLVAVSRRSGNRLILDRALLPLGINPDWRYEVEHVSTSLGFAEAGLGIAVLPRLALPRGRHPVLVTRPIVEPLIQRETGVLSRRGYTLAPAARALLELLSERLEVVEGPARR